MSNKISLTGGFIEKKKEGFYATKGETLFYIGYVDSQAGITHQIPVSEEFYNAAIKESERKAQQYKDIANAKL